MPQNHLGLVFSVLTTIGNAAAVLLTPKLRQLWKDRNLQLRNHKVVRQLNELESTIPLFKSSTETKTKLIQDWCMDTNTYQWRFVVQLIMDEKKYLKMSKPQFAAEIGNYYASVFKDYQTFMFDNYPEIVVTKFTAISRLGRSNMIQTFDDLLHSQHSKKRIMYEMFTAISKYVDDVPNLMIDFHNTNGEFKDVLYKDNPIC